MDTCSCVSFFLLNFTQFCVKMDSGRLYWTLFYAGLASGIHLSVSFSPEDIVSSTVWKTLAVPQVQGETGRVIISSQSSERASRRVLRASHSFEYGELVRGGQGSASAQTPLRSCRDFNIYGYFSARQCWTGFGLGANIVERYVLFSVVLHVAVALRRTCVHPVVVTMRRAPWILSPRDLSILTWPLRVSRCLRAATVRRLPHHKLSAWCWPKEHRYHWLRRQLNSIF